MNTSPSISATGLPVMHEDSDVCIVGNGAIGKTAALGFAQAGQSVVLLCPPGDAPPPASGWDVRVYALNRVARTLLSSLTVWDALDLSRVEPVDAMIVHGGGQENLGKLEFDAFGAHASELAWIVEDRNLNHALDSALALSPNIRIVRGRASKLSCSEGDAVVMLESGVTLGASLVLGADGGSSWVRSQCDIGIDYRSYGQNAVVANFSCEKPHHGVAQQWFTAAEGIVALLPLPGSRVSLVWSAPQELAQTLMRVSLSELADRVNRVCGTPLGRLQGLPPEQARTFPLMLIRPHSMIASRVALAGDAAHVVHPLAGHGMNLGFADVAALLKMVAERGSHRTCGDRLVLERYARARKEEVLLMQVATDGLVRLFGADFEPLRIVRNIGLNLLDRLPVLKRRLINHALGKLN